MGSRTSADGGPDLVTVAPFCLDFTEVTVRAFHASDAGAAPTPVSSCNGNQPTRQLHPVNCIDWFQALRYCTVIGKRLPTEEEFEWAARGTIASTIYPWGDGPPSATQVCWSRQPTAGTCEAGLSTLGRSPQGIDDLAGNVWEWTSSCADGLCASRVARGGSWFTSSDVFLRASYRDARAANVQSDVYGLRCARTP